MIDLAATLLALPESTKSNLETLQPIFHSMTQMALFGNGTDLSLLAGEDGLTEDALRELQKRGKDDVQFILRNDEAEVWDWLKNKPEGQRRRADVVLDNGQSWDFFVSLACCLSERDECYD